MNKDHIALHQGQALQQNAFRNLQKLRRRISFSSALRKLGLVIDSATEPADFARTLFCSSSAYGELGHFILSKTRQGHKNTWASHGLCAGWQCRTEFHYSLSLRNNIKEAASCRFRLLQPQSLTN